MIKSLNVFFIQCSNSGVGFWRIQNFVDAAHRVNSSAKMQNIYWDKKSQEPARWQLDISTAARFARTGELNAWINRSDIVVCQVVHTRAALDLFYSIKDAYSHIPLVVECDDALLSAPAYNPAFDAYTPGSLNRELAIAQFKTADAMIVSTPYLKEVYREFNDNIYVVPNSINMNTWDYASRNKKKNKKNLTIGWAGGANHDEDLKRIKPVIDKILKNNENVRFKLVHGVPQSLKGIPRVDFVPKYERIDKYPKFLAQQGFDIGIAPLVDNTFNRSKSNLRWLEYSSLNIPTVAFNIGHFKETIKDGVDGMLAKDVEEFEKKLQMLIDSKNLRKSIAKEANKRVRTEFNVDYVIQDYSKILQEIYKKGAEKKAPSIDDVEIQEEGSGTVLDLDPFKSVDRKEVLH